MDFKWNSRSLLLLLKVYASVKSTIISDSVTESQSEETKNTFFIDELDEKNSNYGKLLIPHIRGLLCLKNV